MNYCGRRVTIAASMREIQSDPTRPKAHNRNGNFGEYWNAVYAVFARFCVKLGNSVVMTRAVIPLVFIVNNFANTSLKWMTSSSSASGGMTSRPTWSPASSISGNSHVSWSIPVPIYCYINAGVFDAVGRDALLLLVWFLQREGKTLQIILNRWSGTVVRGRTVVVWLTKKFICVNQFNSSSNWISQN